MIRIGTNALFHSDSLSLLERLPDQSVALVYFDPPWYYVSPRNNKKDVDTQDSELEYVAMISKNVQQIKRLLTDHGSLFVHWSLTSTIDIRLIMNQAFGDQPQYEITLVRKSRQLTSKGVPKIDNEVLIVYSKSSQPVYNSIFRSLSPDEKSIYKHYDYRGQFLLVDLTLPLDRPNAQYLWHGFKPPIKRSWRFSQEKMDTLAKEDKIYFSPNSELPRMKQYLSDNAGIEIGTTWDDIPTHINSDERTIIAGQKPMALLKRIIELASNPGDQVLDPFLGSGTTIIAAHQLGRNWWGAESSKEAQQIALKRLESTCNLSFGKDYHIFSENDVLSQPVIYCDYQDILANVQDIAKLQNEVKTLTKYIVDLKKLMNIPDNASDDQVEGVINLMEQWISSSISKVSLNDYITVVCSWLTNWESLEKESQIFLPQAEMIFDGIVDSQTEDFSPFIIQYCRAFENELLSKLFAVYTENVRNRVTEMDTIIKNELNDSKTGQFAKKLLKFDNDYTLGQMLFILTLLEINGKTLQRSPLLRDFRDFICGYFKERVLDHQYLKQIETINEDFRRKAAHPYILNKEAAQLCREHVRKCLNELILNYRHEVNRS